METHIDSDVLSSIWDCCEAGYPNEVCGLLIGNPDGTVVEHVQIDNVKRDPRLQYLVDTKQVMVENMKAREKGLTVIGVWHSHPDVPAYASGYDTDAAYPGYRYIIVSVRNIAARGKDLDPCAVDCNCFSLDEVQGKMILHPLVIRQEAPTG